MKVPLPEKLTATEKHKELRKEEKIVGVCVHVIPGRGLKLRTGLLYGLQCRASKGI